MFKPASVAVALWLLAAPTLAGPRSGVDLRWRAVPGCPDRAAAVATLEELLAQSGAPAQHRAVVTVDVEIARQVGGGFAARMLIESAGQRGERRFEGGDCARVADAAVLIVAMTLDPVSTAGIVTDRAPRQPELGVSIGARAVGDVGSLPAPTAGAGFSLGVSLRRARAEIEGTAFIPRLALRGPVPGSGGEIGLYTGALRACYDVLRLPRGTLGVGPCLGGELGLSTGRGLNISHPARARGLWGAATVAIGARQLTRGALATSVSVELGVPFERPVYSIQNYGEVYRAPPLFGRVALGVAWIFP